MWYNTKVLKILLDLIEYLVNVTGQAFYFLEDNIGGQKLVISQNIILLLLLFKMNYKQLSINIFSNVNKSIKYDLIIIINKNKLCYTQFVINALFLFESLR